MPLILSQRLYLLANMFLETAFWLVFSVVTWELAKPGSGSPWLSYLSFLLGTGAGLLGTKLSTHFVSRFGRKWNLVSLYLINALVLGIFALTYKETPRHSAEWLNACVRLMVVQFVSGLIGAICRPISNAYIKEISPEGEGSETAVQRNVWNGCARVVAFIVLIGVLLKSDEASTVWFRSIVNFSYAVNAVAFAAAGLLHMLTFKAISASAETQPKKDSNTIRASHVPFEIWWIAAYSFLMSLCANTFALLPAFLNKIADGGAKTDFFVARMVSVLVATLSVFALSRLKVHRRDYFGALRPVAFFMLIDALIQLSYPLFKSIEVFYVMYPLTWVLSYMANLRLDVYSQRHYQHSSDERIWTVPQYAEHCSRIVAFGGMVLWSSVQIDPGWPIVILGVLGAFGSLCLIMRLPKLQKVK